MALGLAGVGPAARSGMAGLWWGLLAYKVHWLLAVGWVPLVIGRRRVLLGMAVSAGLLAAGGDGFGRPRGMGPMV